MYFWIQSLGLNPVVKHSVPELAAIAALMWLPVSIVTIAIYNWMGGIYSSKPIWTLTELKDQSDNIMFLAWFLLISVPVSFLISFLYARMVFPFQIKLVNKSRKKLGLANYGAMTSVWEEFFVKLDKTKKDDSQVVRVYKLENPKVELDPNGKKIIQREPGIVGIIKNASRPFETERALVLERCDELKRSDEYYVFEVTKTYVDLKSGIIVEEIDNNKPTKNKEKFN